MIIEVKAVGHLTLLYAAQLLTNLRLSGYRFGLLINVHSVLLKDPSATSHFHNRKPDSNPKQRLNARRGKPS